MNAINPIKRSVLDTPKWADSYRTDFTTEDLVDVWRDEALIATGDDEVVTAYFVKCHDNHGDPYHDMTGISIDDSHGAAFYGMDKVSEFLHRNTILRIEDAHTGEVA